MRANVLTFLVAAILIGAGTAAAQPGPEPGYGSAAEYAQDYAEAKAGNASGDPVTFAQSHASPEAATAEAEHAAYVACWALDDQGIEPDQCDAFYTPRGEAQPDQPVEPVADPTNGTADEALNATETFAGEASEAIQNVTEDPTQAPGAIKRIAAAAGDFLGAIGGAVVSLAEGVVDLLMDVLGLAGGLAGLVTGLGSAATDALLGAVGGLLDGLQLSSQATTGALATVGGALGQGFAAIGSGIATASSAIGGALGTAASAIGDGVVKATKAVGDGIVTAGDAIGDAAQSAFDKVKETVGGWFGGGDEPQLVDGKDLPLDGAPDADGLLDGVTGLLE